MIIKCRIIKHNDIITGYSAYQPKSCVTQIIKSDNALRYLYTQRRVSVALIPNIFSRKLKSPQI